MQGKAAVPKDLRTLDLLAPPDLLDLRPLDLLHLPNRRRAPASLTIVRRVIVLTTADPLEWDAWETWELLGGQVLR